MTADVLEPADPIEDGIDIPPTLVDLRAEMNALGCCLISPAAFLAVQDRISGGPDFYRPAHEIIWAAIEALNEQGKPVDHATVAAELTDRGLLFRAGGPAYLFELTEQVTTPASAGHYAKTVAKRARSRRGWLATKRAAARFTEPGSEPEEAADAAVKEIGDAVEGRARDNGVFVGVLVEELMERIDAAADETPAGVPFPWHDDQGILTPMQPGNLIVLAARPSVGKSTAMLDILRGAARQGIKSMAFSLEMNRDEFGHRFTSAEAGIPLRRLRAGQMRQEDWERLAARMGRLQDSGIIVDDFAGANLSYIRQEARKAKARHDIGVLAVDYLQLMVSGKRVESRQQEVSEFSRGLKLLAKELGIPIIAVSQLNRGPEQRIDRKPKMSDLRESGSIEQDADMVILLHREDFYEPESPRVGEADFIVDKSRHGQRGVVSVAAQLHLSRFVDMAR